jgi:hypothetical protein
MIRIATLTVVAGAALIVVPAGATIACKSSAPRGVAASYRIIDGRKCWYAGRHSIAKSQLAWQRVTGAAAPLKLKPVVLGPQIGGIEFTGSIDQGFEERWQMLAPVDWARAGARR